jgi:hypothetical protein
MTMTPFTSAQNSAEYPAGHPMDGRRPVASGAPLITSYADRMTYRAKETGHTGAKARVPQLAYGSGFPIIGLSHKEKEMYPVVRQGCFVCLVMVMVTLGYLASARAEPSPACRALARQFAETPEKLNADNLYRLQTCLHRELRNRGIGIDESSPLPPALPKAPYIPGLTPPLGGQ